MTLHIQTPQHPNKMHKLWSEGNTTRNQLFLFEQKSKCGLKVLYMFVGSEAIMCFIEKDKLTKTLHGPSVHGNFSRRLHGSQQFLHYMNSLQQL